MKNAIKVLLDVLGAKYKRYFGYWSFLQFFENFENSKAIGHSLREVGGEYELNYQGNG